jgi:hypothetical protein
MKGAMLLNMQFSNTCSELFSDQKLLNYIMENLGTYEYSDRSKYLRCYDVSCLQFWFQGEGGRSSPGSRT